MKGCLACRIALACLVASLGGPASGFHDGGAGRCDGCHVMHDGNVSPGPAGDVLLVAVSPSDVCLGCHDDSVGAVMGGDPLVPPPERGGGNFVFLLEDNLNDAADGLTNPISGDAAGHSIIAPGRGLSADVRHTLAPGGTFPSFELGCTSCHDPHGNDNFRMLYGADPVQGGVTYFASPAPVAVGRSLSATESNSSHTAYKSGMSEWCGNCHGQYHDGTFSALEHPNGTNMDSDIVAQYNVYDGDANPTGGSSMTAYLAAVPFEDPGPTTSTSSTQGPTSLSRVMCLTCHRAHASSAPAAGRWDFNVSKLSEDGNVSSSYAIPSPYADPFQGTLCSKCHAAAPASRTREPIDSQRRRSRIRELTRPVPR